jgi:GNAT superfamily N-acetyltransferase
VSAVRLLATVVLALALVGSPLALPAAAGADGDPASDVLLTQNIFLPFSPAVSPTLAGTLTATVAHAHAAGYPIKVALIESTMDLGADPELFGPPERYARFLDLEITYNSAPPLLVVMPGGFGTASTVPASALSTIALDRSARSDGLARAAIAAIVTLARRAGHPISAPNLPAAASVGGGTRWPAIAAAVALALAVGGGAAALRRRRRA